MNLSLSLFFFFPAGVRGVIAYGHVDLVFSYSILEGRIIYIKKKLLLASSKTEAA